MEHRAAGDAKLLATALALEDRAAGVLVDGKAAAGRAHGLAVRLVPAQDAERRAGFLVRHAGNAHQREGAGLGGEEEVLRHLCLPSYIRRTP